VIPSVGRIEEEQRGVQWGDRGWRWVAFKGAPGEAMAAASAGVRVARDSVAERTAEARCEGYPRPRTWSWVPPGCRVQRGLSFLLSGLPPAARIVLGPRWESNPASDRYFAVPYRRERPQERPCEVTREAGSVRRGGPSLPSRLAGLRGVGQSPNEGLELTKAAPARKPRPSQLNPGVRPTRGGGEGGGPSDRRGRGRMLYADSHWT
jgi:hypothetical protein